MATEWGIFGDEGLWEGDMWSKEEAEKRREELIAQDLKEDPDYTYEEYADQYKRIEEICGQHRDQPADGCEECEEEEEEE